MLVEQRTYTTHPGKVRDYLALYEAEGLPIQRRLLGRMVGYYPGESTDILVIGYGPTGATAANLLGRRGYRVVVVDQAAAIYDKPRAITADQEVLRIFQEIGVADEVVASSTPHPGTDFVGLEGQ